MPKASLFNGGNGSAPALVLLRFDPDPRSATAIRRADPDWAMRYAGAPPRDPLTRRLVDAGGEALAEEGS